MAVILALSDFGHTGINESLRHQLKHWHERGHEIWQLALGYNGWIATAPIEEYPWRERLLPILTQQTGGPEQRFGQGCIDDAIKLAKPDVVISSFDVWMVRYLADPASDPVVVAKKGALEILDANTRSFSHIMYFPMDGLVDDKYLPRQLDEWVAGTDCPVTYSRYAQEAVLRTTGLHIPFIPIGHDKSIYYPGSRKESRARLKLEQDKFIVSMVGTNQYRKVWPEFLEACAKASKSIPNMLVLPWTTWETQIYGGFDILDLVVRNGIEKITMNPGSAAGLLSEFQMGDLYRSMNVNVLTTIGEGAGLPPIRARACGVPALVSNNTSNTEFVGHPFELIDSQPSHYDNGWGAVRFRTDTDELARKIVMLYESEALTREVAQAGFDHVAQYELEHVLPAWDAILEAVL